MGLFSRIFGNEPKLNEADSAPPIYGGDATSPFDPAVVNCASMAMASHLIDQFISELHGEKEHEWTREAEYFVNKPDVSEFSVRAINIKTKMSEDLTYYFNVSRPVNAAKKMAGM